METIKVREIHEREIKISFPVSFKKEGVYYHFENRDTGVVVYPMITEVSAIKFSSLHSYNVEICEKSEVETEFNKVVTKLKNIL